MKPTFFADAWYFIAAADPLDTHHPAALRIDAAFLQHVRVMTHDAVLLEVLSHFSDEGTRMRQLAATMARRVMREHDVIAADRDLFLRALDLYERRADKEYSLVDCMSFVVMRERGIDHVLTNDQHFRQEGFTVLSDAP